MLIVSGTISFDPAKADRFDELVSALVPATLAESGCITYGFWSDPTDRGRVRVYEEWESPEAIGEHMATDHMAAFMTGMGDVDVNAIELHQHVVAESTQLM